MSSEYTHGLAADMRRHYAMSTADKVGGAYTGWKPRPRPTPTGQALAVLVGAVLAAVAVFLGHV